MMTYKCKPVWNFLFRIKRTSLTYLHGEWAAHQSLQCEYLNLSTFPLMSMGFQTNANYMKFLVHPVNKGTVPIHYKYFIRNLTLHHFLLSPCLEEIPISGWFVTRLGICIVAQTPHIFNYKSIQTPYHQTGPTSLMIPAAIELERLNDWLSTTAKWSIKHLHWTISLALTKLP